MHDFPALPEMKIG